MNKIIAKTIFTLIIGSLIISQVGCYKNNNDQVKKSEVSISKNSSVKIRHVDEMFKNQVTISYASWDVDKYMRSAASDAVFQKIAKKLNVKIEPIGLTYDDYTQKIQMWAAIGQLPDVCSIDAVGTQFYSNWIEENVIKALPVNLSIYPNLQKYMDTPDIKALMVDGKYYCIPRKSYPSLDYNAVDRLVEYRWDLAQRAGITKQPETWEDFKAMLKAIVEKDPEGKKIAGFTCVNIKQIGGFFWLFSNPAATSDGSGKDYKWINEDGKYMPAVFSKNALPSLQNLKDMYDKGLIDKDIALIKGEQGSKKFVSGQVAALLHAGGFTTTQTIIDRWKEENPNKNYTDCVKQLKPLKTIDGRRYHSTFKTYWSESYFNAKMDDEKMDRVMRLYDFLLSDEGHDYLRYGIKGVDYIKSGDKYTELLDYKTAITDKYKAMPVFKEMVEWDQGFPYDNIDSPVLDPSIRQSAIDYIKYIKANTKIPEFNIRLTYLSTPSKEKLSILDYEDMLTVMLSREPAEKTWSDIVNGYMAKGLDKAIKEVNEKAKEMGIN